ncbi:MAG: hypothetical protein NTW96_26410 [Planctomycetia bacterium]|nr:hypothetical protein [Planctomycetia bacterium]
MAGDYFTYPVVPDGQNTVATCWLTCYGMLYQWRGLDKTQIGPALASAGIDVQRARVHGLLDRDLPTAAGALTLAKVSPSVLNGARTLIGFVRATGPVWLAGRWNDSKHVMILCGGEEKTNRIEIIDPWMASGADTPCKALILFAGWFQNGLRFIEAAGQCFP